MPLNLLRTLCLHDFLQVFHVEHFVDLRNVSGRGKQASRFQWPPPGVPALINSTNIRLNLSLSRSTWISTG